ncbi:MAG: hypothetical protein NC218_11345 [Acetobacter sp.]|nr:hypothetical protein [Acetobacter sp.]
MILVYGLAAVPMRAVVRGAQPTIGLWCVACYDGDFIVLTEFDMRAEFYNLINEIKESALILRRFL